MTLYYISYILTLYDIVYYTCGCASSLTVELHPVHPPLHLRPADVDGQPVHICVRLLQRGHHRQVLQTVRPAERAGTGGNAHAHTCANTHVHTRTQAYTHVQTHTQARTDKQTDRQTGVASPRNAPGHTLPDCIDVSMIAPKSCSSCSLNTSAGPNTSFQALNFRFQTNISLNCRWRASYTACKQERSAAPASVLQLIVFFPSISKAVHW